MPEVRILHFADMHLGWPFPGLVAQDAKGRLRSEELKAVFAEIIDLALREQVDLVLMAGDLFEQKYATRGLMQFIDGQFRRLGAVPVFISPGNHDPYLPGSYYETYPWAENVHIFGPEPERVDLAGLPVSVRGWGFPTWEVRESVLGRFPPPAPGRVNLVVLHGGDAAYHPLPPQELAGLGADYIALGHIHKEGPVLERAGRVIARYSGSPEALGFGEPGMHGVFVGTVSTEFTGLSFIPVGHRQYVTADVHVSGAVSLEDLAAAVAGFAPPEARQQHAYRLTLTGAVHPELHVDLALLQERLQTAFWHLKLADATAPDVNLEELARERSARGLMVRRLLDLQEAEADAERRQVIGRALVHGLAAFLPKEGGR